MPNNRGSIRVLEKCGYRREGLSIRYLKIAGAWRDLLLFARTAEDSP
jgi:ribosomal-protein-alanine N-acetyltransferase